ncbi:MAG: ecdysteroid 22-kinase family protein [bacterium]|nr:ecdysteroid 22-kinase family protein [bacterium]
MSERAEHFAAELQHDAATRGWFGRHVGGRITGVETVQELWSGYGSILRVRLADGPVASVICKRVSPPRSVEHPRGWAGRASDERKRRSYDVERCFYSDWVGDGAAAAGFRTAKCHAAEATADGWRFLLEDLDASGYAGRFQRLDRAALERCLGWLAAFHARYLGVEPDGLWSTGTYWHLATRSAEFDALRDPELRAAAPRLDALLNGCRYQTLVHGDAKVANFCFAADDVAAVDFQYVGGGCGIKDVVYFLSSCLDDVECEAQAAGHLDSYFAALRTALSARVGTPGPVDADAVEAEWRALYPAAWADFHRFLQGWAPDHWKIHDYTREMTRLALRELGD